MRVNGKTLHDATASRVKKNVSGDPGLSEPSLLTPGLEFLKKRNKGFLTKRRMSEGAARRIQTQDAMISCPTLSPQSQRLQLLNQQKIFAIYALTLSMYTYQCIMYTLTLTLILREGVSYLTLTSAILP